MADTLYFTRHGETFWNVENKICGATDIALTPRGHAQAEALGRMLAAQDLPVDLILSSPLSRALDTARHIAAATGWPLQVEERLREQNFGRFEGTPRDGADFKAAKACFAGRFGGGESMLQLLARLQFFRRLRQCSGFLCCFSLRFQCKRLNTFGTFPHHQINL